MRLASFTVAALCAATAFANSIVRSSSKPPTSLTAKIKNGTVKGVAIPSFEQEAFLGVPYAAPPARFEHSVARSAEFEGGVFVADNYSSVCYGIGNDALTTVFPLAQSEDCLSINIVRPAATTPNDKLPVMFWIHGGELHIRMIAYTHAVRYQISFYCEHSRD